MSRLMEWESPPMTTMIEQAKEELQILESHHPDRFDYLKLELKLFISQLQSQSLLLSKHTNNNNTTADFSPVTSSTSTQESSTSNSKKRKKKDSYDTVMKRIVNDGQGIIDFEASKKKYFQRSSDCQLYMKSRDRDGTIDAVIAKAQVCLHKIKHFKTTF